MKKAAFERGITLVALVITIIVLLILAGVTFNMILGEDGLIEKAKRSAIVTELKELQEKVDIAISAETVKAQKENRKFNISEYETLNSLGIESKYSEMVGVIAGKIYMKKVATEEIKTVAQSIGAKIGRLPEEYQEVEYIESTGTQYIDTGYIPNSNTKIELDSLVTNMTYNNVLFGTRTSGSYQTSNNQIYCNVTSAMSEYKIFLGTSLNVIANTNKTLREHLIFDVKNLLLTNVNNNETQILDSTFDNNASYHLYLFALNNIGGIGTYSYAKIYTFKIWDNDVLVRDMIACYDVETNAVGMYDKVNNIFYTNKGTGEFIKGNDV